MPGGRSLTAHALDVKRQIADFRDAGLDDIADEMEAELKLYVRSMTKMGSDSVTTPPPVHPPQGFLSRFLRLLRPPSVCTIVNWIR